MGGECGRMGENRMAQRVFGGEHTPTEKHAGLEESWWQPNH